MANSANIFNINKRRRAMLDDSAEPDRGYIHLHRKLLDQPFNRCPVKSSVWMYLLLNASHKPYRTYLNGQMVVLQAGQIVTGRKKIVRECFDQDLMEVTEAMVRGALNRFVKEEMISVESTRSGSIITIINWDRYQGQKPTFANQPLTKGANQPSNLPVNQAQPTNDAACSEVLTNPLTSDLTNPKPTPLTTIQEYNNKPLKEEKIYCAVRAEPAQDVIDHLNSVAGKQFKGAAADLKIIIARLTEGFTVDELKTIIDVKTREWKNDPRNSKYLRPKTLFSGINADSYLNNAPSRTAKACPHKGIIELYHATLTTLPRTVIERWEGSDGAADLETRWNESVEHQSREFWTAFFEGVKKNDNLTKGDIAKRIGLGWLVKRSNFDRLISEFINGGLWGGEA